MMDFAIARRKKWLWVPAAVILIAVILTCVFAPFIIKHYLNHRVFRDMGNYTGRVNDVDVNVLRGSYVLRDLVLWRKEGNLDVPFFKVKGFYISISWEALWHGSLLASVVLEEGELNFLDARKPEERQSGTGTNWLSVLDKLLPTTLHRLEIRRSRITFQNFDVEPKVHISAENLDAVATNLTNVKDKKGLRVATATATAKVLDGAQLEANARFDPFDFDDFDFAGEMRDIHLPQVNSFTTNYLNVDFEDGRGELYVELTAKKGKLTGYAKPLFHDVNIMSWRQDVEQQKDNPLQLLWEGALGFLKMIFTNSETKRVATQIEITGTIDKAEIDSWQAVAGIVKNAFFKALQSRFEELTTLTRPDPEKSDKREEKQEETTDGSTSDGAGKRKNDSGDP
jgi:hypothetical protein